MKEQQGRAPSLAELDIQDVRLGIVASRFNSSIVDRLVDGAQKTLAEAGIAETAITLLHVPGAFELPLAARQLAVRGDCEGVIALGAVIRGETAHFDYVCRGATDGLMRVCLDYGIPIGFGLLTVENEAQALARATEDDNKGRDAVETVLEMISVARGLRT